MYNFSLKNEEMKNFERIKYEHFKSLSKLNKQIDMNEKKLKKTEKPDEVPEHYTNNDFFTKVVSISMISKLISYAT